jgi:hypothetical protein
MEDIYCLAHFLYGHAFIDKPINLYPFRSSSAWPQPGIDKGDLFCLPSAKSAFQLKLCNCDESETLKPTD